jgi:hypothetical protein
MDLVISIPEHVASKLKERAEIHGQTLSAYTSKLVAENVTKPQIDEILAPVREDFAKTGMTDDQIMEFGRGVLNDVRLDKKAKSA